MATTKKRINISVSRELDTMLGRLAKRDQMSLATKAEHMLIKSLEFEEDEILNFVAESRDQKGAKFISHEEAWR